jgi:hypothetical protein
MNLRKTAIRAAIVSGLGAAVLTEFTTAPDYFTQAVVAFVSFIMAGIVILIMLWSPWLRKNSPERQRRMLWAAACSTAFIVCFTLPKMFAVVWYWRHGQIG